MSTDSKQPKRILEQLKEARCFKELGLIHFKMGNRETAIYFMLSNCEDKLCDMIDLCRIFDVPDQ